MNTKTIITIAALCILTCFIVKSQVEPPTGDRVGNLKSTPTEIKPTSSTDMNALSGVGIISDDKNFGKKCSIYLDNEWKIADVILNDNSVLNDVLIRYNIYTQEMQFIEGSDTIAFGNPAEIASISFNNRTFIFSPFYCDEQVRQGYFEVLCEGDCKLLLHRCIKYKYVEECSDPNSEFVKEEFYMGIKYYTLQNNQPAQQLPGNKKELINRLSKKDCDVKSFMKENKIKLNRKDDLVKLFAYYNAAK